MPLSRHSQRRARGAIAALSLAVAAGAPAAAGAETGASDAGIDAGADPVYETVVEAARPPTARLPEGRARSEVTRDDLELRLPRSAPDALRYEPGVFVQQTAHGQGSAFVRGLTGQQTLLLFDGIRLNNGTFRQGPNQYFFTLDSSTIERIEVLRGGASTRYGSDALGGAILALPIEPRLNAPGARAFVTWDPHLQLRAASADDELGGRLQTNLALGESFALFGGVGARRVGLLESGGSVLGVRSGRPPQVPHFAADGRTQLGTGFDEVTADGTATFQVNARHRLRLSAYAYRQFDAPRTDQCPSAYAPHDECLAYDEQFRTLAYGAWESEPGALLWAAGRLTLSYQDQHERRTLGRPSSYVENVGRDDVRTFGATLAARTRVARAGGWLELSLAYGADTYHDVVRSAAWISFTDIGYTERLERGQYVDGSTYTYGGAFAEATATLLGRLTLRGGGRVSWIGARAPAVPAAGAPALDRSWFPLVGSGGVEVAAAPWLSFACNADRSFRAPNLNDLTARQQTGPGFQFENPQLAPEVATTTELGARLSGPLAAELWLFRTLLDGMIAKNLVAASECPPDTPACQGSWTRLRLDNAGSRSEILGVEALLAADFGGGLSTRLTLSWAWGEGPNLSDPPSDPSLPYRERVPLSRIPPLNGTAELLWRHRTGFSLGAALRWAAAQTRLAIADESDARIPDGGTPGFAVLDLRASWRLRDLLLVSLAFENVFDAAYRYHGSAINGPARGVVLFLDAGPLWRL